MKDVKMILFGHQTGKKPAYFQNILSPKRAPLRLRELSFGKDMPHADLQERLHGQA